MKKRLITSLLALAMTFTQAVSLNVITASADNEAETVNVVTDFANYAKLQNNSFETGDLTGWTVVKNNTLTASEEKKIHGTYTAKYVSDGVEGLVAYQELPTFRNTNYLVAASVSRTVDTEVRIYADSINDDNILAQLSRTHSNGSVYSEFRYITTGEYDKIIVAIYDKTGVVNEDCYIDNIYVTPAKYLQNPGFEDGSINGLSTVGANISYTTSEKSSGNGCLKIQTGAGQYPTLMIPIALNYSVGNNDAIVRYKFKYKVESGSAYFTYGYNGGYTWSSIVDNSTDKKYLTLSSSSNWQEMYAGNNTLAYATDSKRIYYLAFQVNANSTIYLDDFEIVSRWNADIDKITITGENTVGSVLTARIDSHTNAVNDINLKYPYRQWQRSSDGVNWTNIGPEEDMVSTSEKWGVHTTYTTYTVSENDSDMYVRLQITPYRSGSQKKSDVRYYTNPVKIAKLQTEEDDENTTYPVDVNETTDFKNFAKIQNASFETGDLTNWQTNNPDMFKVVTSATRGTSTIYGPNGANFVEVTPDGTGTGILYQEIDAYQNMNYVFNAAWCDMSSGYGNFKIYGDSITNENLLMTASGRDASWYNTTKVFNSGEHKKLIVTVSDCTLSENAGRKYWIDNITIAPAYRSANYNFESGDVSGMATRSNPSVFTYTEEDKYSGNGALKFISDGYNLFYAPFALPETAEQVWGMKFKCKVVQGALGYKVAWDVRDSWNSGTSNFQAIQYKGDTIRATDSDDWQTVTCEHIVRLDAKNDTYPNGFNANKIYCIAFQNMASNTIAYIDDIEFITTVGQINTITITGKNEDNGVLTAEVVGGENPDGYSDSSSVVTYQWQRSTDGKEWEDIEGENSKTYSLSKEDSRMKLRLKAVTSRYWSPTSFSEPYYSKPISINEITVGEGKNKVTNTTVTNNDGVISVTLDFKNPLTDADVTKANFKIKAERTETAYDLIAVKDGDDVNSVTFVVNEKDCSDNERYQISVSVGDFLYSDIVTSYSVILEKPVLKNSSNEIVSKLSDINDGILNVSQNVRFGAAKANVKVYGAVYDENGKLYSVSESNTLSSTGVDTKTAAYTLSLPTENLTDDYTLKTFLWDNGMKPYSYGKTAEGLNKTYGLDVLLDETKPLKVAYFGGSQTQGGYYSNPLTSTWNSARSGGVTQINAGVGGSGTEYGAYRVYNDVISKNPDVVFVEFTLNDMDTSESTVRKNLEGVIRQLKASEHEPVVIFLFIPSQRDEKLTASITNYNKVLSRYGLTGIDLHGYFKTLVQNGDYTYSDLLNSDGVHLNSVGGSLCADYIYNAIFGANQSTYFKNINNNVTPMFENGFNNPKLLSPLEATYDGDWEDAYPESGVVMEGYNTPLNQSLFEHYMVTSKEGAKMTLTFEGDKFMIEGLRGRDGRKVTYIVYDEDRNIINSGRGENYISGWDWYKGCYLRVDGLGAGKHTITITAAPNTDCGNIFGIGGIWVDE